MSYCSWCKKGFDRSHDDTDPGSPPTSCPWCKRLASTSPDDLISSKEESNEETKDDFFTIGQEIKLRNHEAKGIVTAIKIDPTSDNLVNKNCIPVLYTVNFGMSKDSFKAKELEPVTQPAVNRRNNIGNIDNLQSSDDKNEESPTKEDVERIKEYLDDLKKTIISLEKDLVDSKVFNDELRDCNRKLNKEYHFACSEQDDLISKNKELKKILMEKTEWNEIEEVILDPNVTPSPAEIDKKKE